MLGRDRVRSAVGPLNHEATGPFGIKNFWPNGPWLSAAAPAIKPRV